MSRRIPSAHSAAAVSERLEPRRLFDASLGDGVLVVIGRVIPDDIIIRQNVDYQTLQPIFEVEIDSPLLEIPATYQAFPAEQVRSVLVRSGGGNDLVDMAIATYPPPMNPIDQSAPVSVPTRVDGGVGDDRVFGGTARDYVAGGWGNDLVDGGAGDDWVLRGNGDDTLVGGAGNDFLYGQRGNDVLFGDDGDDRMFGGAGDDTLGRPAVGPRVAEPGNDLIVGGLGKDRLLGGAGEDRVFGGPGLDTWVLSSGAPDDRSEWRDKRPEEPIDQPPEPV